MIRRITRLIKIVYIVTRYRLDEFFQMAPLPGPLRWLFILSPWRLLPDPKLLRAVRLRLALEALGPVFVKFGQMLSTRRDLLPDDIAWELQKLQDQVPPFPSEQSMALIEKGLGQPINLLFKEFEPVPLASASVAQVHTATLLSGEQVVIKVIRPGIEKTIHQDLELLFTLAQLVTTCWVDGRRLRPVEVVSDYRKTIFNELDQLIEAGNTSQLKRNFQNSELLNVPQVYWDYTRKNILVMERIHGIPVADIPALNAQGTDMKKLAERGVEIFFTQVFRDSFFHADMHPGNIFVDVTIPKEPSYIAVDCGIVGTLTAEDKNYLARILLAFFKRNYRQVALLHIESGWVPPDTPVGEFETAIRSVCEPIFEKPLKDISFGNVLLRLFQTARQFDMQVQPQLVLLQKTLLNIEGLGRQLYPELDLWHTAKPFLENWMKRHTGPMGLLGALHEQGPGWLERSSELPQLLTAAFQQISQFRNINEKQQQNFQLLSREQQNSRQPKRSSWFGLGALVVALLVANEQSGFIQQIPMASWAFVALGFYWIARDR